MLVFIFIKKICFKLWPPLGSNAGSIPDCINYRIKDTKVSRTCMGRWKDTSTWEHIQNVPTLLPLTKTPLPWMAKRVEFWGVNVGGWGSKEEYYQVGLTWGESGPCFSLASAQHIDKSPDVETKETDRLRSLRSEHSSKDCR